MRLLLDEDVPKQTIGVLRHLLRQHTVAHIHELGWSGKKDVALYRDAKGPYDAILTNNHRQLDDPDEVRQTTSSIESRAWPRRSVPARRCSSRAGQAAHHHH